MDARLYEKARVKLVALAKELGLDLRQTYARKAPRLAMQIGRYAHARQYKRMRKALRTLRGYTGRVMRDIRRRLDNIPAGAMRDGVAEILARVSKLLHQAPKGKGKIYALHEPDVDCISKGKARVRYEFGCKVSLATTIDECFVVGMRAMLGNPYDGHTLAEALEQVEALRLHGEPVACAMARRATCMAWYASIAISSRTSLQAKASTADAAVFGFLPRRWVFGRLVEDSVGASTSLNSPMCPSALPRWR